MPNWVAGYDVGFVAGWLGADDDNRSRIAGYGPDGVGTLVLDLESGFTVAHSWTTKIRKFRAGGEQRRARNDIDRESYSGSAHLLGGEPRALRVQLANYAASGAVFQLALPHEALPLVTDSVGAVVYVPETDLSDWAQVGQRVVVANADDDDLTVFVNAVIQDVGADWIDLDVEPGDLGLIGGQIMPCKPIYLVPQQNIPRLPKDVEMWNLEAVGASPLDFAPALLEVPLSSLSSPFANVSVMLRQFDLQTRSFELAGNAGFPVEGVLVETGAITLFRYRPGVTTLGDLATALGSSVNFILTGTWNDADTFGSDDIYFEAQNQSAHGEVGRGVTLDEYADRPVWDEPITVPKGDEATDGLHAMTQIIDHGGARYSLGQATRADWFRDVRITNGDMGETWQWFKLFMSTVRGREKSFWLPTWREDLEYVEHSGTSLTVGVTVGGDILTTFSGPGDEVTAFWPKRDRIQIEQANGTVTYAQITAVGSVDDGTRELTLSASLSASPVTRICWLELCRFENADEYTTTHAISGFSVQLTARAVPQDDVEDDT